MALLLDARRPASATTAQRRKVDGAECCLAPPLGPRPELDALGAFRAGKTDEPLRRRRLGLRFDGYIFYVLSCSPKCERRNRLHIVNLAWRLLAGLTQVKTAKRPRRGSRWQLRGLKAIPGGLPPRVEG